MVKEKQRKEKNRQIRKKKQQNIRTLGGKKNYNHLGMMEADTKQTEMKE